jgi:hypothetical protein
MSQKNLLYTNLTPSLFIEVPELRQEGSFICVLGISNLHVSTIFLLNAGTVPTVCYIFFHFIIGYEKPSWVAIVTKIWLWSSSVIKIVKMKYNRIKWCLVSTSFKIYLDILSYLYTIFYSCSRSFITTLFHSSVHFFLF